MSQWVISDQDISNCFTNWSMRQGIRGHRNLRSGDFFVFCFFPPHQKQQQQKSPDRRLGSSVHWNKGTVPCCAHFKILLELQWDVIQFWNVSFVISKNLLYNQVGKFLKTALKSFQDANRWTNRCYEIGRPSFSLFNRWNIQMRLLIWQQILKTSCHWLLSATQLAWKVNLGECWPWL